MDDATVVHRGVSNDLDRTNGSHSNSDNDSDRSDSPQKPIPGGLPDDLPTSLDDRRSIPVFPQETEMYDAWQGMQIIPRLIAPPSLPSQPLTACVPTRSLS